MTAANLAGRRFGRLTAIERVPARQTKWRCACDCGSLKDVFTYNLMSGHTTSCGCFRREASAQREVTHGMSGTPTHTSWEQMLKRCRYSKSASFERYGAKGVAVCERWQRFENFLADMGVRPDGMTLDRIKNEIGYEPSNCRWATPTTQARNRSVTVLSEDLAEDIRRMAAIGLSAYAIGATINRNPRTVSDVMSGRTWKRNDGAQAP